jgi:hypothetical protein
LFNNEKRRRPQTEALEAQRNQSLLKIRIIAGVVGLIVLSLIIAAAIFATGGVISPEATSGSIETGSSFEQTRNSSNRSSWIRSRPSTSAPKELYRNILEDSLANWNFVSCSLSDSHNSANCIHLYIRPQMHDDSAHIPLPLLLVLTLLL